MVWYHHTLYGTSVQGHAAQIKYLLAPWTIERVDKSRRLLKESGVLTGRAASCLGLHRDKDCVLGGNHHQRGARIVTTMHKKTHKPEPGRFGKDPESTVGTRVGARVGHPGKRPTSTETFGRTDRTKVQSVSKHTSGSSVVCCSASKTSRPLDKNKKSVISGVQTPGAAHTSTLRNDKEYSKAVKSFALRQVVSTSWSMRTTPPACSQAEVYAAVASVKVSSSTTHGASDVSLALSPTQLFVIKAVNWTSRATSVS